MFIKKVIKFILKKFNIYSLHILKNSGALYDYGWFLSFEKKQSINKNSEPIPWYTYPFIEFIYSRINNKMKVYEYGTGNSTLWWQNRVNSVITIEHDENWHEMMKNKISSNVYMKLIPLKYNGEYCKHILKYENEFDIVIIDGRDRVNCAYNSIRALNSDGIIIWDDSERNEYIDGYKFLIDNGFKRIDFIGMAPISELKKTTSVFYKEKNCLNI